MREVVVTLKLIKILVTAIGKMRLVDDKDEVVLIVLVGILDVILIVMVN